MKSVADILHEFSDASGKGHHSIGTMIAELANHHPCALNWFKRESFNIQEAFLIYHNIDPDAFIFGIDLASDQFIGLIDLIDLNDHFYRNLKNYVRIKGSVAHDEISISEFIKFLHSKGYGIPEHFPDKLKSIGEEKLIDSADSTAKKERALLPSQRDAIATQYFYRYLLATKNPKLTPGQFVVSNEFKAFAKSNGFTYSSKNMKQWLIEIDPRPKEERKGRPRKEDSDPENHKLFF